MADTKLYKILGISKNAAPNDIKKAYRKRAKECHPDKNANADANEKFKELSFAYEVLSDPNKRALYDRHGLKAVQEQGPDMDGPADFAFPFGNFFDAEDIFRMGPSMFSGFSGMGMRMGRQKKNDSAVELTVTLEDLYNGNTLRVPISREVICSKCSGLGGRADAIRMCNNCHGRGQIASYRHLAPGFSQQIHSNCAHCKGQGKILLDKDKCNRCVGQKILKQTESLEVRVNKGMKDKQKILFRGKGDQGVNMEPGDFYVVLDQVSHSTFKRIDDDLIMKVNVSLADALCGFQKVIRQLDGRDLLAKIDPGDVLTPGCMKRIDGEGMPLARTSYERGNLILEFNIEFPENHFCDEVSLKMLEKLLPPRPASNTLYQCAEEDIEEVNMFDLSAHDETGRSRTEAYGSDDDEPGPNHLRCAHQ